MSAFGKVCYRSICHDLQSRFVVLYRSTVRVLVFAVQYRIVIASNA
jgi:hypothetical protein